jgi:hypothetical protein
MRTFTHTPRQEKPRRAVMRDRGQSFEGFQQWSTYRIRRLAASHLTSPPRCTADWRQWWADESERIGSNWRSFIQLHFEIVDRLRAKSSLWGSS